MAPGGSFLEDQNREKEEPAPDLAEAGSFGIPQNTLDHLPSPVDISFPRFLWEKKCPRPQPFSSSLSPGGSLEKVSTNHPRYRSRASGSS